MLVVDVDIRLDMVEPTLTAVIVEPLDLSRLMECYDRVYAFLRRGDSGVTQTGHNIALYEHGRMEIGVEVDQTFEPAGPVVSSCLPGGRIAHATHTTGYGDLHRTYDAIRRWCEANGQEMTGTQWERYADPDESGHVDVEVCCLCGDERDS